MSGMAGKHPQRFSLMHFLHNLENPPIPVIHSFLCRVVHSPISCPQNVHKVLPFLWTTQAALNIMDIVEDRLGFSLMILDYVGEC
jgi:hypothetical protein